MRRGPRHAVGEEAGEDGSRFGETVTVAVSSKEMADSEPMVRHHMNMHAAVL